MVVGPGLKALMGGVVVCAVMAGCTTTDPERSAPEPTPSTSSSAPDPATISVGVYGPAAMLEAYDTLAKAFTDANPHITVELETHEDAEGVMAAIESRDAPDVFLMDHDHVPRLVADELVQPVDGLLEARQVDFGDGYQRGGLTAFAADARLQCMPHDVSPAVVYYNQDLVNLRRLGGEDEEPPTALDGWSWELFTTAARRASRGPGHGVYIEPSLESIAPFVWSAGGEIVDDVQAPTTLTLSDGDSREALEQVLALVRDPKFTPTPRQLEEKDALRRFIDGELGMIIGTRALTPELREAPDLRFDVMPLPSLGRQRTIAEMNGYCVSADTDEVEAAGDFLAFAVGRQGAAITARTGYVVPSNLEVAHSAVFAQESRQPASSFIFNEGVRRAQTSPFTPVWPELSESVESAFNRMFYAPVIDLDSLLEEIDTTSTRVLAPKEE
ncbi:MAG TPA: extracellular solute-binding protein [Nocardioidaceae bacterium]|nr:extracellular solute-binding protein [Nocardioidaceae bacterium]